MPEGEETRRPSQRQAQADARRELLLRAALDLFAARGVRGSTVRDIARAAGVTEGVIYHYFVGKEALAQAVIERFTPVADLRALFEGQDGVPVEEALFRIALGYFETLTRNRKFVQVLLREFSEEQEPALALGTVLRPAFEAGLRFMQGRIASGELRPHPHALSLRTLMGSVLAFFLVQSHSSSPLPPVEPAVFIRGAVAVVLHGVAAAPANAAAPEPEPR